MLETDKGDGEMGLPLVLCRSRGGPYATLLVTSPVADDFEFTTPGQE